MLTPIQRQAGVNTIHRRVSHHHNDITLGSTPINYIPIPSARATSLLFSTWEFILFWETAKELPDFHHPILEDRRIERSRIHFHRIRFTKLRASRIKANGSLDRSNGQLQHSHHTEQRQNRDWTRNRHERKPLVPVRERTTRKFPLQKITVDDINYTVPKPPSHSIHQHLPRVNTNGGDSLINSPKKIGNRRDVRRSVRRCINTRQPSLTFRNLP